MKFRRMMTLVLAVICIMSVMAIPAFAAEILEVPSPENYFGCSTGSYRKDGKTSLEYYMPCHDESAIEDYIELLEGCYGLKLKKSTYIPSEGDYYYSLSRGNANCLMLYWDKSYELMTVTVYDKIACLVADTSYCSDVLFVESPAAFFGSKTKGEYHSSDNTYTYDLNLGSNGMTNLAYYIYMLREDYGMVLDSENSVEVGNVAVYCINNAAGELCMVVTTLSEGKDYYAGFAFDADLCIPMD